MQFFYQIMNLILVVCLLGVPIIVTVLLLRHFSGKKTDDVDSTDFLIRKINELEERVQELENRLDINDID